MRQNRIMSTQLAGPQPELLEGLRLEFGDSGQRAVEFLATARGLLQVEQGTVPRVGCAVAYCIREAMTSILSAAVVEPAATRKDVSRRVVEARDSYEQAASLPGGDADDALAGLLARIEDLDNLDSQERFNQKRLIAVMIARTGAEPLSSGTRPVHAYQDLLDRANRALHRSCSDVEALDLWLECIALFRQLFIPPEIRNIELEQLARVESPTTEQQDAVCGLVVTPQNLRYFFSKVTSPVWLDLLTPTRLLDPPDSEGVWPIFGGVLRLAENHHAETAAWLERMYARHRAKSRPAWDIARAALDIGEPVLELVFNAVEDHPEHSGMLMLGDMAVQKLDAADELVERFADLALNEDSFTKLGHAEPLIARLSEGINETNALRRVELLFQKMQTVPEDSWSLRSLGWRSRGFVTDRDRFLGEDRFEALLSCMIDSIQRAWKLVPVGELLAMLETLPAVLGGRLRVWTLGKAPNIAPELLVEEVEHALESRGPVGDDLALIDRAVAECEPHTYAERWRDALGQVPTIDQAGHARRTDTVPQEWMRAMWWVSLLPNEVAGAWVTPCDIISAPYGPPGREDLERRVRAEGGFARSPYSAEQLQSTDPDSAADMIRRWRPGPDDWLVTAEMLARTLESVVTEDPQRWLVSPMRTAMTLHHPTYISHYLRAAASLAPEHHLPVAELLDVIKLVRSTPWTPEQLGDHHGDYDSDWANAEHAAIELIKALALSGCTFDHSAEIVWEILESDLTSDWDGAEVETGATTPTPSSIDRRHTQALEAVLLMVQSEFRASETVRPQAIALLERSLRLSGHNGIASRAVLAPSIGFLLHVLPDWTEANRELLVGDEAPEGFGQITVDEAIRRSSPNAWLLKNARAQIHDAVQRDIDNALNHLLVAMLWGIQGYSAQQNAGFVGRSPDLASQSAEALGRLLHHGEPEPAQLEIATEFWRAMLQAANSDALLGFGWLSIVDSMDAELWAELTLQTLEATGGRLAWSHAVGERVTGSPPSLTGLAIMDRLVRAQNDPWGNRRVIEEAVALVASAQDLSETDEHRRLHRALLERGAIEN